MLDTFRGGSRFCRRDKMGNFAVGRVSAHGEEREETR